MGDNLEKGLLNEILKREKELHALKQAYGVLTGSEIIGIGSMAIELPPISEVIKPKVAKKVVDKKIRIGTPAFREKISEAMTESWKRRKAGLPSLPKKVGRPRKVGRPIKVVERGIGKWAGLTKEQKSAEISKRMTEYWRKRREEGLTQRGLPTRIDTHHTPVEPAPVIHTPVPVVPEYNISQEPIVSEPSKGRLAFLPVGRVRKNRIWTEEEEQVLVELWKKFTPAEIAKRLLRTVRNVEKRYVKLKEDAVIRKTLRMPKSERGAKFMDSYRKSWDSGLTKTKQRWSPEEDAGLMRMARSGWTSKQISKELKRSVGSVVVRYRIKTGQSVIPADRKRGKRGEGLQAKKGRKSRSTLSKRNLLKGG